MAVVPVDFGKEARESARAFARLMKIVDTNEAAILANPGRYLDMASKRLAEAERFASDLYDALHGPWAASIQRMDGPPEMLQLDTVTIDRRDYAALLALKALINARGP